MIFSYLFVQVYELMENAIQSPLCDELVEAEGLTSGPTGTEVNSDDNYDLRLTPCDFDVRVPDEVPEGRKIGICE